MSREIKFRAWNGERLITGDSLYWNGISFVSGIWNFEEDCIPIENQQEVELMQYTGLKDKNGFEIYEGDIVQVNSDEYEGITHVEYECGCPCVFTDGDAPMLYEVTADDGCKVIGNIYQNPELLEASNG